LALEVLELAWAAFGDGFFVDGAALGLSMGTFGQLGDGGAPASLRDTSCPCCSALSDSVGFSQR